MKQIFKEDLLEKMCDAVNFVMDQQLNKFRTHQAFDFSEEIEQLRNNLNTTNLFDFNYKKDFKVFLGDSGSLFIGGLVSIYVLKILSNDYVIKLEFDLNKILFVISILSYPIIDFTRVIFLRLYNGVSPFLADRRHIHHIIYKKTNKHYKVVTIIIIAQITLILIIQGLFNFII